MAILKKNLNAQIARKEVGKTGEFVGQIAGNPARDKLLAHPKDGPGGIIKLLNVNVRSTFVKNPIIASQTRIGLFPAASTITSGGEKRRGGDTFLAHTVCNRPFQNEINITGFGFSTKIPSLGSSPRWRPTKMPGPQRSSDVGRCGPLRFPHLLPSSRLWPPPLQDPRPFLLGARRARRHNSGPAARGSGQTQRHAKNQGRECRPCPE